MNLTNIILKIKSITGFKEKEIAEKVFEISAQNLSTRKKENRLDFPKLIQWAVNNNVDLNWLLLNDQQNKGFLSLNIVEQELIKALRTIDPVSRKGIYFSAINQLRESMREKEISRDKRKMQVLENAVEVLKKAI
jgi:hypothetical protein